MNHATNKRIRSNLKKIETDHGVVILYACEAGSRAWGLESINSDYDVRFIYIHPPRWYLSLDNYPDIIECPVNKSLDISGWELRKTLRLLRKSNPPLLEWLHSPVIYYEHDDVIDAMRSLIPDYYSAHSCHYHYLHRAQGDYRHSLNGTGEGALKRYCYVLRSILACQWIEREMGLVPAKFDELVSRIVGDQSVKQEIGNLINKKKSGNTLAAGNTVPALDDYISTQLKRLLSHSGKRLAKSESSDALDAYFRQTLTSVWGNGIET